MADCMAGHSMRALVLPWFPASTCSEKRISDDHLAATDYIKSGNDMALCGDRSKIRTFVINFRHESRTYNVHARSFPCDSMPNSVCVRVCVHWVTVRIISET